MLHVAMRCNFCFKNGKIEDHGLYDFLKQNNDYFRELIKNIN